MAGNKTLVDEKVAAVLTCKYMGWDWYTYQHQPLFFVQIINLLRQFEAEESNRHK